MGNRLLANLISVLIDVLWLYRWVVIIAVIYSLLHSFGALDTRARAVWMVGDVLQRLTEPFLRPIRRVVRPIGGIDFSPFILLIIILLLMMLLGDVEAGILTGFGPLFY